MLIVPKQRCLKWKFTIFYEFSCLFTFNWLFTWPNNISCGRSPREFPLLFRQRALTDRICEEEKEVPSHVRCHAKSSLARWGGGTFWTLLVCSIINRRLLHARLNKTAGQDSYCASFCGQAGGSWITSYLGGLVLKFYNFVLHYCMRRNVKDQWY